MLVSSPDSGGTKSRDKTNVNPGYVKLILVKPDYARNKLIEWAIVECTTTKNDMAEEYDGTDTTELAHASTCTQR